MAVITIGPGATDRAGAMTFDGYTDIDFNVPATGSGTLKAIDFWFTSGPTGFKAGTFYRHATSNEYWYCRDSAVIAPVSPGSKVTVTTDSGGTALSINVNLGDYFGMYCVTGQIERDTTGYSGVYFYGGDGCNSGDLAQYAWLSGDAFSAFASGATPAAGGGAWTQFASANGQSFDLIYSMPGIAKDVTSKVQGMTV